MFDDLNYNSKITFDDGTTALIYANRLHNEKLDNWKGWQCGAGVNYIYIYQNEIYSGECCNDKLGILDQDWELVDNYTICKLERCSGCTSDLIQKKQKP
jgi:hypothetical protein